MGHPQARPPIRRGRVETPLPDPVECWSSGDPRRIDGQVTERAHWRPARVTCTQLVQRDTLPRAGSYIDAGGFRQDPGRGFCKVAEGATSSALLLQLAAGPEQKRRRVGSASAT